MKKIPSLEEIKFNITEAEFQGMIVDLAHYCNWEVYHTWNSLHSAKGFPDLVLCKPPRLLLWEVKTEKGKMTQAQIKWGDLLSACPGVEYRVVRPSDWEQIVKELSKL